VVEELDALDDAAAAVFLGDIEAGDDAFGEHRRGILRDWDAIRKRPPNS